MIVLPAIDLLGGNCVRLVRGAYDTASKVAADALETARGTAAPLAGIGTRRSPSRRRWTSPSSWAAASGGWRTSRNCSAAASRA